jgi:hypothetical protein
VQISVPAWAKYRQIGRKRRIRIEGKRAAG